MTSQSHEGPKTERVREKWMFCMCERHGLGQPGRRDSCQEYLVGGGERGGKKHASRNNAPQESDNNEGHSFLNATTLTQRKQKSHLPTPNTWVRMRMRVSTCDRTFGLTLLRELLLNW